MSVRITERKNGDVETLKKNLRSAAVTVGLHEAEGLQTKKVWGEKTTRSGEKKPARVASESGETLIEVMLQHEFGVGVPQRSFLSAWFDEEEEALRKRMFKVAKSAADGKFSLSLELERFGKSALANMKGRIREGIAPALSERRKREKAKAGVGPKDTPLIFTSQFINALKTKAE